MEASSAEQAKEWTEERTSERKIECPRTLRVDFTVILPIVHATPFTVELTIWATNGSNDQSLNAHVHTKSPVYSARETFYGRIAGMCICMRVFREKKKTQKQTILLNQVGNGAHFELGNGRRTGLWTIHDRSRNQRFYEETIHISLVRHVRVCHFTSDQWCCF